MKKQVLCFAVAVTAALGMTVFAEGNGGSDPAAVARYDTNSGNVTSNAVGIQTVLITNKNVTAVDSEIAGENIYYIGQENSLNTAAGFAIKANPEPGTYYLVYNTGVPEDTAVLSFMIGNAIPKIVGMKLLEGGETENGDSTFNRGFVVNNIILSEYKSLVFKFINADGETVLGYSMDDLNPKVSGEGAVNLGVQLDHIDKEYKNAEMAVYLSTKTISEYTTAEATEE